MAASLSERSVNRARVLVSTVLERPAFRPVAAVVAGVATTAPLVLHGPLADGVVRLGSEAQAPGFVGAAVALLLAQAASACAWRAGLVAGGSIVSMRRTFHCYGAGSLANTALPGNAGDVVRVGLFVRAAGRDARWMCGGVCLAVSAGRALLFCSLLGVGACAGFG